MVVYGSGLRLEEICRLRPEDIDFSRNMIIIRGKGNKEREVPIDVEVAHRLSAYIKKQGNQSYIFEGAKKGRPYARRTIQKIYEYCCEESGTHRRGGIHTLRHSYATHLRQQGIDLKAIQDLLGHGSIKTTQVYLYVGNEEIQKIASPLKGMKIARKKGFHLINQRT